VQYGGVPPYPETRDYVMQVLRLYGTSSQDLLAVRMAVPTRPNSVRRIVQPGGTVLYTNIAYGSR
jgi:hypothetical protein